MGLMIRQSHSSGVAPFHCKLHRLSLGLHSQLLIAGLRCVVQLSALGYVLMPIFAARQPWLVLGYAAFMTLVSAVEAVGRPSHVYEGMFVRTLAIISAAAGVSLAYALVLVIRVQPWWTPHYLIPMLGMVLGNTISGVSVGTSAAMEELGAGKAIRRRCCTQLVPTDGTWCSAAINRSCDVLLIHDLKSVHHHRLVFLHQVGTVWSGCCA
jgi:ABC-type iron transport system FetAB permease component